MSQPAVEHLADLLRRLQYVETMESSGCGWTWLQAPLTSTSWDGDSYSDTAKTLIDLSAVFGVPAGVKAVDVTVFTRDSGSAATSVYVILAPTNANNIGRWFTPQGLTNDAIQRQQAIIPCDANGDIYYQVEASGASTMDIWIQIWGYELPSGGSTAGGLSVPAYTIANGTLDRTYDANSTSLDELADILYTLIHDLGGA